MTARLHRKSLGILLAVAGCSFDSLGLGEGEPGGSAPTETNGGPTGGSQASEGAPTTGSETGGPSEGTNGMTGMTSMTGVTTDTTGMVDPTTGDATTGTEPSTMTGPDPSTTTGVDPSTTGGCVEQTFFKDGDNDGFGDPAQLQMGCEAPAGYVGDNTDCNDGSDKVNPEAAEVCGEGDNDCDGQVDEFDAASNVDCGGCKMFVRETTLYHFCGGTKSWDDAKAACEGRKAVLVKDGDEAVHDWLMDRLDEIDAGSGSWWLGARTPDGNHANFAWRDGTKLGDFKPWAAFNPTGLNGTNCVRVASPATPVIDEQWTDWYCSEKHSYICEGPLP